MPGGASTHQFDINGIELDISGSITIGTDNLKITKDTIDIKDGDNEISLNADYGVTLKDSDSQIPLAHLGKSTGLQVFNSSGDLNTKLDKDGLTLIQSSGLGDSISSTQLTTLLSSTGGLEIKNGDNILSKLDKDGLTLKYIDESGNLVQNVKIENQGAVVANTIIAGTGTSVTDISGVILSQTGELKSFKANEWEVQIKDGYFVVADLTADCKVPVLKPGDIFASGTIQASELKIGGEIVAPSFKTTDADDPSNGGINITGDFNGSSMKLTGNLEVGGSFELDTLECNNIQVSEQLQCKNGIVCDTLNTNHNMTCNGTLITNRLISYSHKTHQTDLYLRASDILIGGDPPDEDEEIIGDFTLSPNNRYGILLQQATTNDHPVSAIWKTNVSTQATPIHNCLSTLEIDQNEIIFYHIANNAQNIPESIPTCNIGPLNMSSGFNLREGPNVLNHFEDIGITTDLSAWQHFAYSYNLSPITGFKIETTIGDGFGITNSQYDGYLHQSNSREDNISFSMGFNTGVFEGDGEYYEQENYVWPSINCLFTYTETEISQYNWAPAESISTSLTFGTTIDPHQIVIGDPNITYSLTNGLKRSYDPDNQFKGAEKTTDDFGVDDINIVLCTNDWTCGAGTQMMSGLTITEQNTAENFGSWDLSSYSNYYLNGSNIVREAASIKTEISKDEFNNLTNTIEQQGATYSCITQSATLNNTIEQQGAASSFINQTASTNNGLVQQGISSSITQKAPDSAVVLGISSYWSALGTDSNITQFSDSNTITQQGTASSITQSAPDSAVVLGISSSATLSSITQSATTTNTIEQQGANSSSFTQEGSLVIPGEDDGSTDVSSLSGGESSVCISQINAGTSTISQSLSLNCEFTQAASEDNNITQSGKDCLIGQEGVDKANIRQAAGNNSLSQEGSNSSITQKSSSDSANVLAITSSSNASGTQSSITQSATTTNTIEQQGANSSITQKSSSDSANELEIKSSATQSSICQSSSGNNSIEQTGTNSCISQSSSGTNSLSQEGSNSSIIQSSAGTANELEITSSATQSSICQSSSGNNSIEQTGTNSCISQSSSGTNSLSQEGSNSSIIQSSAGTANELEITSSATDSCISQKSSGNNSIEQTGTNSCITQKSSGNNTLSQFAGDASGENKILLGYDGEGSDGISQIDSSSSQILMTKKSQNTSDPDNPTITGTFLNTDNNNSSFKMVTSRFSNFNSQGLSTLTLDPANSDRGTSFELSSSGSGDASTSVDTDASYKTQLEMNGFYRNLSANSGWQPSNGYVVDNGVNVFNWNFNKTKTETLSTILLNCGGDGVFNDVASTREPYLFIQSQTKSWTSNNISGPEDPDPPSTTPSVNYPTEPTYELVNQLKLESDVITMTQGEIIADPNASTTMIGAGAIQLKSGKDGTPATISVDGTDTNIFGDQINTGKIEATNYVQAEYFQFKNNHTETTGTTTYQDVNSPCPQVLLINGETNIYLNSCQKNCLYHAFWKNGGSPNTCINFYNTSGVQRKVRQPVEKQCDGGVIFVHDGDVNFSIGMMPGLDGNNLVTTGYLNS